MVSSIIHRRSYPLIFIHVDRIKPDVIAGREQELGFAGGIEQPQRCAPYQLPTAGALHGVYACLPAGNAHRAGGDLQPGRLLARGGNAFVHPPEVTEAGGEAKHVHEAVGGGVDGDNIAGGEAVVFGYMKQVGTRLAAVEDRDVDDRGGGQDDGRGVGGTGAEAIQQAPVADFCRVITDHQLIVRRYEVGDTRDVLLLKPLQQLPDDQVHLLRDYITGLDDECRIARGNVLQLHLSRLSGLFP